MSKDSPKEDKIINMSHFIMYFVSDDKNKGDQS